MSRVDNAFQLQQFFEDEGAMVYFPEYWSWTRHESITGLQKTEYGVERKGWGDAKKMKVVESAGRSNQQSVGMSLDWETYNTVSKIYYNSRRSCK